MATGCLGAGCVGGAVPEPRASFMASKEKAGLLSATGSSTHERTRIDDAEPSAAAPAVAAAVGAAEESAFAPNESCEKSPCLVRLRLERSSDELNVRTSSPLVAEDELGTSPLGGGFSSGASVLAGGSLEVEGTPRSGMPRLAALNADRMSAELNDLTGPL